MAFFDEFGVCPLTVANLRSQLAECWVWLVPPDENALKVLERRSQLPQSKTIWVSQEVAERLGVDEDRPISVQLTLHVIHPEVKPARLDNFIRTDQIVLASGSCDSLIDQHREERWLRRSAAKIFALLKKEYFLLTTEHRTMVVTSAKTRSGRANTDEGYLRMNFHARRVMGLAKGDQDSRPNIQVAQFRSTVHPNRNDISGYRFLRRVLQIPSALLNLTATLLLRAPHVSLVVEESAESDDQHGIARVNPTAMGLLGVDAGDQVLVSWGARRVLLRVAEGESRDLDIGDLPEIVEWRANGLRGERPRSPYEDRIALPARARAELGMPRNGVAVVRRYALSRVRRRLGSLALPTVALAVAVPSLGIGFWPAASIVGAIVFLAFAEERLARSSICLWP